MELWWKLWGRHLACAGKMPAPREVNLFLSPESWESRFFGEQITCEIVEVKPLYAIENTWQNDFDWRIHILALSR
jgi:hypothetical protein